MTHYDGVSWPEAASAEDLKLVSDELLARRREAAAYYDIMGWAPLGANGFEFKIDGTDPIFDSTGYRAGNTLIIYADPDNPDQTTNDFVLDIPMHRDEEFLTDMIKLSFQKNSEDLIAATGARIDANYMHNLEESAIERARALTQLELGAEVETDEEGAIVVTSDALQRAHLENAATFGQNLQAQFEFGTCDKMTIQRILEVLRRASPVEPHTVSPWPTE